MNPKNQAQARQQVRHLLNIPRIAKAGPYQNAATRRQSARRAEAVAEAIWREFNVGIYRWRTRHLRWYASTKLVQLAPGTRYQYLLAIRRVLGALGKDHLYQLVVDDFGV